MGVEFPAAHCLPRRWDGEPGRGALRRTACSRSRSGSRIAQQSCLPLSPHQLYSRPVGLLRCRLLAAILPGGTARLRCPGCRVAIDSFLARVCHDCPTQRLARGSDWLSLALPAGPGDSVCWTALACPARRAEFSLGYHLASRLDWS